MGKTFVAAALCLDRVAYCIALPNSLRQWVREATKIGARAVWAESSESLWRHVASLTESSPRAGLIILSHTLLRSHNFWQLDLPQPDLLIVDEIHKARGEFPPCVFRLVQKFSDVFTLGLTASLDSNDGRTESAVVRLLGLDPRALPGAVVTVAACANAAVYPTASFEFKKVHLSNVERSAYAVATEIGSAEQVIRAMLFPATSDESGGFQARVWQDIMKSLSQANVQVERDLVAVLTRAANRLAYRPEVEEKLGADIAARIFIRVARWACPESFDSEALTRRRVDGVWESHARPRGAYTFVSGALAKVGASVPVECPICSRA